MADLKSCLHVSPGESEPLHETIALPMHRPQQAACTCRHRWCPRRIHAMLGVVVGLFVVAHLAIATTGLWPGRYQELVDRIHRLGPALPAIELIAVFIPLLAQFGYGLRMLAKIGLAYHTDKQSRGGNPRFFLQRLSAVILLLFIAFHVATMHRWGLHLLYEATGSEALKGYQAGGLFHEGQAFSSTARAVGGYWAPDVVGNPANLLVAGFYALGIWAVCYHLANGLATAAMAWGITVTATAQRRATLLCLGLGVALAVVGTAAWYAFNFASS
jgi:succinate dehydrogenase / fumarate reductase cytochrome b subunit